MKILRRRPVLSSCNRQSPVRTWKLATALGYLDAAMLHQGSVYSGAAPFIRIVGMLLGDPRTAMFAQACQLEIRDEDLICDACPAGRDEADLQRIYRASRDWRPDRIRRPARSLHPP